MLRVGIIGGAGYTGSELVRLLLAHREMMIESIFELEVYEGKAMSSLYPNLKNRFDLKFEKFKTGLSSMKIDLFFLALPHSKSFLYVKDLIKEGKKVIDLSADFRFKNKNIYEEWYNVKHETPELLKEAVYGLPELYRKEIKKAHLLANPGCYPTSVILGLAPAIKNSIIDFNSIIVDSKSGTSGAGRGLTISTHFTEANENLKAYNICSHRHMPEIEQELTRIANKDIKISFTPHLVPMNRGILSSIYAELKKSIDTLKLLKIYREFYKGEPFIRVLDEDVFPQTKAVYGSNYCDIGLKIDERKKRLIVITAIDNLVKGASGQAIQNMNIMYGFDETEGLREVGIFP